MGQRKFSVRKQNVSDGWVSKKSFPTIATILCNWMHLDVIHYCNPQVQLLMQLIDIKSRCHSIREGLKMDRRTRAHSTTCPDMQYILFTADVNTGYA